MIKFKKIRVKNFLSFGNSFTEFKYKNGLDLVVSHNGSGKSSIGIEALYFAVFGKPYRKIKLQSLINNINEKELLVELFFDYNGKEYQIRRGLKPQVFEIYENGELLDQLSHNKNQQEFLTQTLMGGVSENIFRQLIVLGANISSSKAFLDLNKQEKEDVFQIIADTEIFKDLKIRLKEKLGNQKTLIREYTYQQETLEKTLESEQIILNQLIEENELKKEGEKALLKEELDNKNKIIEEMKLELSKFKPLKDGYEKALKIKETIENNLSALSIKRKEIEKEIQKLEITEKTYSHCIGCKKLELLGVAYSEEELNHHRENLQINDEEIKIQKSKLVELNKKLNSLKERLDDAKALKAKLDIHLSEKTKIEIKINTMLDSSPKVSKSEESLKNSISEKKEQIKTILTKLSKDRTKLEKYQRLESLLDSDRLKGVVISMQLPLFNKLINEYLEKFSGISYNIFIDKDFTERIILRGEEKEYNSMSNGEKMRINFSILFAFHKMIELRNGFKTNLLVLDEVLDSSADYNGRMELLEILKREYTNEKDVIIISHNTDIVSDNSEFDRIISIDKSKHFSKIIISENGDNGKDEK
jgi:DNA repair exonuclease SbcCD ATPase subunit